MGLSSLAEVRTTPILAPGEINPVWLARGLTYVSFGNGLFWSLAGGWAGAVTITGGPKRKGSRYGVTNTFGATDGFGTTDRLDGPPLARALGWRSIVSFSYANTTGGGDLGRIFQPLGTTGGSADDEVVFTTASAPAAKFVYRRNGSAAAGEHYIAGSPTLGAWACYGVTHDQRTVGQTPFFYENGISAAVTLQTASTGTFSRAPYTPSFGNRSTDSSRGWDGLQGPCMFFDHSASGLTAQEHRSLYDNPHQIVLPQTRTIWVVDTAAGGAATAVVAATDVMDTAAATAQALARAVAAATDAPDTASATVKATTTAVASATDLPDTASATATATARAVAAATDTPDTCAATGGVTFTFVASPLVFTSPARAFNFVSGERSFAFTSPARSFAFTSPARSFAFTSPARDGS